MVKEVRGIRERNRLGGRVHRSDPRLWSRGNREIDSESNLAQSHFATGVGGDRLGCRADPDLDRSPVRPADRDPVGSTP